ncbi:hypothetical protein GA0111570_112112 [Raineyella antarctica]|uniref:Uncharacterized protein n=1 Tax=Raineyella antarctica TaxID=1577474 RepID=A0A1G6HUG2_9ACTN|nr:hypothetical protein [Raineyella antarctica]SDB97778.1 hypothetical protein GA0111570_112112 [Raineyella antarctica]
MSTPRATSSKQMTIMVTIAVVVVVLGVVLLVGWLSSQAGSRSGSANPATNPLVLPETPGDFRIDPNQKPEPTTMPLGSGQAQSVTGTYYQGNVKSLLVMAVRPVDQLSELVTELDISAARTVGDGLCGRYPTGQDVCVVRADNVGVVGVGLDGQTLEQVVEQSTTVAKTIVSQ